MSTQHTPGPWIVVQEHYATVIRGAEVEHEELGTKFTHRGYVGTTWGTRTPTTDADAQLMAAAPELLEALQKIAAGGWNNQHWAMGIASAAIVKATEIPAPGAAPE